MQLLSVSEMIENNEMSNWMHSFSVKHSRVVTNMSITNGALVMLLRLG